VGGGGVGAGEGPTAAGDSVGDSGEAAAWLAETWGGLAVRCAVGLELQPARTTAIIAA